MKTITDKTKKLWTEFNQLNATKKTQILTLLLMLVLFAVGVEFWYFLLPIFIVLILKGGNQNKLDYIGAKIAEPFLSAIDIILAEPNQSQEKSIKLGVIILGIVIVAVTIIFWSALLPIWGILGSIPAFVLLPKRFKFNQLVTGVIILLLVVLPVLSKSLYAPARERISEAEELRKSEQYKKSMDVLKEAQRTLAVGHFDKYISQINNLIEKNNDDIQERQERNKKKYDKGLKAFNSENWQEAIKYFGQVSKHFEKYNKAQDKKKQAKIAQDKQEYEEGLKAFNNKEWGKAIEYFRKVSSDCNKYEAAEVKRKEAITHREKREYYQGLEAFNAGEWEKSIEYFEKVIGEYSDEAESKIQQAEEHIRQSNITDSLEVTAGETEWKVKCVIKKGKMIKLPNTSVTREINYLSPNNKKFFGVALDWANFSEFSLENLNLESPMGRAILIDGKGREFSSLPSDKAQSLITPQEEGKIREFCSKGKITGEELIGLIYLVPKDSSNFKIRLKDETTFSEETVTVDLSSYIE